MSTWACPRPRARRSRPRRGESGVSSVELALYMPVLLLVIFLCVQFGMIYLGNQAASAVARQTSRVARSSTDDGAARRAGDSYVRNIGRGILEDAQITITRTGDTVRVTVTGRAQKISPIAIPRVSQTVEGPIERYVDPT